MEQDDKGSRPQADANNDGAKRPSVDHDSASQITKANTDTTQTEQIRELQERSERRERITLVVAVIGVLIAAGSVYVSERQRSIMERQLSDAEDDALRDQVTLRNTLRLAQQQAQASTDAATAMTNSIGPAATSAARAAERSAASAAQMAGATKSASESAAKTADAVTRQLERIDRPSLTVSLSAGGPVTPTAGGMDFIVQITITNEGRSEATGIIVRSSITYGGREPPLKQLADTCKIADVLKKSDYWGGASLGPDRQHVTTYQEFLNTETILEHQMPVADVRDGFFVPIIVGCVAYNIPYSDRPHHTPFAYNIFRRPSPPAMMAFQLGVAVPIEDIRLVQDTRTKQQPD